MHSTDVQWEFGKWHLWLIFGSPHLMNTSDCAGCDTRYLWYITSGSSALQIGASPSAPGSTYSDTASPAWPPKCTGCELILYSKESYSLEIKKRLRDESGRHPKVCRNYANWQESPTVKATGRGNSPPQHPGWPAYVWMDIFRHCAGFLSLYLCFTAGIDMASFSVSLVT